MKHRRLMSITLLAAAFAAPTVPAQTGSLKVQDYGGIKYVTGGVGQDERAALKAMERDFSLCLMFAVHSGEFLSSVRVQIQGGGAGTVLDAVADGPYFCAGLPAGSYIVTASLEGIARSRAVKITEGRLTRADFFRAER